MDRAPRGVDRPVHALGPTGSAGHGCLQPHGPEVAPGGSEPSAGTAGLHLRAVRHVSHLAVASDDRARCPSILLSVPIVGRAADDERREPSPADELVGDAPHEDARHASPPVLWRGRSYPLRRPPSNEAGRGPRHPREGRGFPRRRILGPSHDPRPNSGRPPPSPGAPRGEIPRVSHGGGRWPGRRVPLRRHS